MQQAVAWLPTKVIPLLPIRVNPSNQLSHKGIDHERKHTYPLRSCTLIDAVPATPAQSQSECGNTQMTDNSHPDDPSHRHRAGMDFRPRPRPDWDQQGKPAGNTQMRGRCLLQERIRAFRSGLRSDIAPRLQAVSDRWDHKLTGLELLSPSRWPSDAWLQRRAARFVRNRVCCRLALLLRAVAAGGRSHGRTGSWTAPVLGDGLRGEQGSDRAIFFRVADLLSLDVVTSMTPALHFDVDERTA